MIPRLGLPRCRLPTHGALLRAGAALLFLIAGASAGEARTRFHEYTDRWANRPDRAAVLGATRLGGSGTEWFAAGVIQADGTVVAAGSTLGPAFDPAGLSVSVLRRDGPAPTTPAVPATDARGRELPFQWSHPQATGFVVRYATDLRTVKGIVRLPWLAGGITGACGDPDGSIYLAGPAGANLGLLGPVEDLTPASDPAKTKGSASASWVAKFTPDATRVLWIRRIAAPCEAPSVRLRPDGTLLVKAGDIYHLDRAGRMLDSTTVSVAGRTDKGGTRFAVNAVDGRSALGGDRQWRTGREPYRDPWLHIHRPDGTLDLQLYWWNGGYVGHDSLRLVSDSAIRMLRWTDDGDLVFVGWSDGGNSVFTRMPFDVRRPAPNMAGLRMDGWGMGVLSQAWLVRLDGTTWQVKAGTNWLSYLAAVNKPNGIGIDSLGMAVDGSFLVSGGSAWGLIRTGNHLTPGGAPGGSYVAVFASGLDSLRFSSCLPGIGKVRVVDAESVAFTSGAVASGPAKGRTLALVLSGATQTGNVYGEEWEAPTTVGAAQVEFGGGRLDAHLLLLDLTPGGTDAAVNRTAPLRKDPPKAAPVGPKPPPGINDLFTTPQAATRPASVGPGEDDEQWLKEL